MLLNTCKNVGLAVNTRKTKYMEVGGRQGMMANMHIKMKKVQIFRLLIDKSKFYSQENRMYIEGRKFMLLFSSNNFVFSISQKKLGN